MTEEINIEDEVMIDGDPHVYRVATIQKGEAGCTRGGGKIVKVVKIQELKKHDSGGPMKVVF